MQLSRSQTTVAVIVIAVAVLGLGYLLWSHSGTSEPVVGPGQTLQNPFGNARPTSPGAGPPSGAGASGPGGGLSQGPTGGPFRGRVPIGRPVPGR